LCPGDPIGLDAHRKRQEIKARYDAMIAEFGRQHNIGVMLLRMELSVRIAVAESNRDRELKGLEQ
jgi:hypothetical protein